MALVRGGNDNISVCVIDMRCMFGIATKETVEKEGILAKSENHPRSQLANPSRSQSSPSNALTSRDDFCLTPRSGTPAIVDELARDGWLCRWRKAFIHQAFLDNSRKYAGWRPICCRLPIDACILRRGQHQISDPKP
jgi:hypothetical protein